MRQGKSAHPILTQQAPSTTDNGLAALETVRESRNGPMALATSGNGKQTELTERESSFISMETSMKASGPTTKPMAMESTSM